MATIERREGPDLAVSAPDPFVLAELIKLASTLRLKAPADVASGDVLRDRKEFLRESLGASAEAEDTFERVIGGNELQPISYLERGAIAACAVARVDVGNGTYGTGFLIAPQVLITNNHVLPDAVSAARAKAQFRYEVDLADVELPPTNFRLRPDDLFFTLKELDYSVVAVEPISAENAQPLSQFGCLPLIETTGKVSEAEWLTIIQHPKGARKQICVRENQFIKRDNNVLWYSSDTEPGSSGSPVFNNDWYVVALHHSAVEDKRDGQVLRNTDGSTKYICNEGIRVSRIVQTLKQARPDHRLLTPLYAATPASARITTPLTPVRDDKIALSFRKETVMAEGRTISVPLEITLQPDGRVASVSVGGVQSKESTDILATILEKKKSKPPAAFDVEFDDDYSKRKGYIADFLGKNSLAVPLPKLSDALEADAAPLIKNQNDYVLKYHNYSAVVHAKRRLPIYSAANVSFANRYDMSRPPDVWRRDPRIKTEQQLENWYYASNQFDRGHLTRREDLEFGGSPQIALASAADTCHWTNCTPQHAKFNQNKEIWQGIERYVLEQSIFEGHFNAQIITGPVLDSGDPEYREVQYPLQFWKVVAALKPDGKLFATAYIASQEEVIDQFGIEVTEVPFGPYKTFQTKISEIERLTGLRFFHGTNTPLSNVDPLATSRPRRRSRPNEAFGTTMQGAGNYFEITTLEDIQV